MTFIGSIVTLFGLIEISKFIIKILDINVNEKILINLKKKNTAIIIIIFSLIISIIYSILELQSERINEEVKNMAVAFGYQNQNSIIFINDNYEVFNDQVKVKYLLSKADIAFGDYRYDEFLSILDEIELCDMTPRQKVNYYMFLGDINLKMEKYEDAKRKYNKALTLISEDKFKSSYPTSDVEAYRVLCYTKLAETYIGLYGTSLGYSGDIVYLNEAKNNITNAFIYINNENKDDDLRKINSLKMFLDRNANSYIENVKSDYNYFKENNYIEDMIKCSYALVENYSEYYYINDLNIIVDEIEKLDLSKFNTYDKILVLEFLGITHRITGQVNQAIKYLEESKKLCSNGNFKIIDIIEELSRCYRIIKEYDAAFSIIKEGIDLCNKIANYSDKSDMINTKGIIYLESGNLQEAIKCFEEAKDICIGLNEYDSLSIMKNIALSYMAAGYLDQAEQIYIEINEKLKNSTKYTAYSMLEDVYLNLASIYNLKDNPSESLIYCDFIIEKYHDESRIDLNMKENYLLMSKNNFLLYDNEKGYEQFELGVHYLTLAVQAIELENILYPKPINELNQKANDFFLSEIDLLVNKYSLEEKSQTIEVWIDDQDNTKSEY